MGLNAPVLRCAGCGCIADDRPDWLGLLGRDPDRENKPMLVGRTVTGTGIVQNNITYQNVGSQVKVTAHAADEKSIALELSLEEAWLNTPEDGVDLVADKDKPVKATEIVRSSVETKLSVVPGSAAVVTGVKTTSKSGRAQTLVIVTHDARVAATADRLISMRDGEFTDETRLSGGTTGRLGALVGLARSGLDG